MPRDPQKRLAGEGAQPVQPEKAYGPVPEDVIEPDQKRNTADTDWLPMASADPALYLKDSASE